MGIPGQIPGNSDCQGRRTLHAVFWHRAHYIWWTSVHDVCTQCDDTRFLAGSLFDGPGQNASPIDFTNPSNQPDTAHRDLCYGSLSGIDGRYIPNSRRWVRSKFDLSPYVCARELRAHRTQTEVS